MKYLTLECTSPGSFTCVLGQRYRLTSSPVQAGTWIHATIDGTNIVSFLVAGST